MKKLIASATILLALLSSCSPAAAKEYFTKKPVVCGPIDTMINKYSNNIGENPFNKVTGTWTLLEFLPDGVQACVVGKGIGIQIIKQEQGINL